MAPLPLVVLWLMLAGIAAHQALLWTAPGRAVLIRFFEWVLSTYDLADLDERDAENVTRLQWAIATLRSLDRGGW